MTKMLISLFTGHCYILAYDDEFYYVSVDTENHDFTKISKELYEANFKTELVANIIHF